MTEIVIERGGYDIGTALKRAKTRPDYYQETILLEVARRISDAMEKQGVSRAELARKLGVSSAYITKVLRGHENFSLQTLARIAGALESKWEFLLINRDVDAGAYGRTEEKRPIRSARVAERADGPAYGAGFVRPVRREPKSRRQASTKKSDKK